MSKENKLTVGNHTSAKAFLDAFLTSVSVPSTIKVVDKNDGIINEGQENQRPWASLTCVDKKLYETFASIGQEDYCPIFKVKLKNYQSENLDGLINADIVVNKYELSFVLDKLKQPIGLALVTELADISLKQKEVVYEENLKKTKRARVVLSAFRSFNQLCFASTTY